MPGQLNSFQRTMLHWSDLHPYNAVHVVRIVGPLDLNQVQNAIAGVLQKHGLVAIELNRSRGTFVYPTGIASVPVSMLAPGADPQRTLAEEIRRQLNAPFEYGVRFCPFRFFVLPARADFWLGLVYFHAVADAECIIHLLREMAAAVSAPAKAGAARRFEIYPPRFDNLLRHQPAVLARKLLALPAEISVARASHRPPVRDDPGMENGFRLFGLSAGQLAAVLRTAAAWEVTANDLFLALQLQALAPLAGERLQMRRRNISVGNIVNLRRALGQDGARVFGLFLGLFVVTHAVPPGLGLKPLAQAIQKQTRRTKDGQLYLATPVDLAVARIALKFFSLERKRKFYQKNRPLWGGLTNMNLNPIWQSSGDSLPADYLRAVSTGPATPLVLSITTVSDAARVSLSYRTAIFSAPQIEAFQARFLAGWSQLEAPR
jgi:hypothetical protein